MTQTELLDTIRAEIERRIKSIEDATGDFAEGRRLEQRIILSFLDTLQEPEVDLDEEIDNFMFHPFQNFKRVSKHCLVDMGDGKEWVPVYDWKITTYKRADAHFLRKFARHFYELGLKNAK